MSSFPVRLLLLLVTVFVVGGALLGGLYSYASNQGVLARDVLDRANGDPQQLLPFIADVRGTLLTAAGWAMAVVLACGLVFVAMVESRPPLGDAMAASRRGLWVGLLFAALLAAAGFCWFDIFRSGSHETMAPGVGTTALAATIGGSLIAYWLGTMLGVRNTSRASVPGARLLNR